MGTSAPLANAYTYRDAGRRRSGAVSPDNGPAAGTNTVTVTGLRVRQRLDQRRLRFRRRHPGRPVGNWAHSFAASSSRRGQEHGLGDRLDHGRWDSALLANAYTYNGSVVTGGAVALDKSTALVGDYPEKVSGTGGPTMATRPSPSMSAPARRTVRRRATRQTR